MLISKDPRFSRIWTDERLRDRVLSHCDRKTLAHLRLTCLDASGKVEPLLFKHISVTFKSRTFSNLARMAHLERIGRHVDTFTFRMPHTALTMLPPLIDYATGEEKVFTYMPQARLQDRPSSSRQAKDEQFGCRETADMLIAQYPPLFHAATNVPAFYKAFSSIPNLKHLRIDCPSDKRFVHTGRSVVDYALISLRIAVEQASLARLNSFSIMSLHEEGLLYLQPLVAFGSSPVSSKRWSSIRHLNMRLQCREACDEKKTSTLKILHAYLGNFSGVESFKFQWQGNKGPFPLSLHNEPRLIPIASREEGSRTPPMRRLKLVNLKCFVIQNATTDAWQISNFLYRVRRQVMECDFQGMELRSGDWSIALEPLEHMAEKSRRKQQRPSKHESMDVPIILSPDSSPLRPTCVHPTARVTKQVSFETTISSHSHPALEDTPAFSDMQLSDELPACTRTALPCPSKASKLLARAKGQLSDGKDHFKHLMHLTSFAWR